MMNILFGVSITLNIIFILGIFIYIKIKTFGIKKVQKEFANKFFYTDDEIDEALKNL